MIGFVFTVHCRSVVRFVLGVSGLPYYRAPFVCVLNGLEGLAVWRLSKPKTDQKILGEGATDFFPLFLGSEYLLSTGPNRLIEGIPPLREGLVFGRFPNKKPGAWGSGRQAYGKCKEVLWTFVTFVYKPQTHRQVFKSSWSQIVSVPLENSGEFIAFESYSLLRSTFEHFCWNQKKQKQFKTAHVRVFPTLQDNSKNIRFIETKLAGENKKAIDFDLRFLPWPWPCLLIFSHDCDLAHPPEDPLIVLRTACACTFRGVTWQVGLTSWLDRLSLVNWFEKGPEARVTSQLDKWNMKSSDLSSSTRS